MIPLKTNTATTITVGPFLDSVDGVTPKLSLTATNEKLTMVVDGTGIVLDANATASGGNNDFVHVTGDDAGYYTLELTAAQTNYLGAGKLNIGYATDHCPVFHEIVIHPANVYDALYGSDKLQVDVVELVSSTQSATDLKDFADTGYDPSTHWVQGVILANTAHCGTGDSARLTLKGGDASNPSLLVQNDFTGYAVRFYAPGSEGIALAFEGAADAYVYWGLPILATSSGNDIRGVKLHSSVTGSAFTTIPWNSDWDAEVQSECADALTAYGASTLTAAQAAAGVWRDTVAGDFTVNNSIGKSVMNGVSLGTGLTVAAVSGSVGSVTGNVGGNVTGSVGSVVGAVGSVTGNVGGNVTGSVGSLASQAQTDAGTGVWGFTVWTGWTALRALKNACAVLMGKSSGLTSGAGTVVYRDVLDSTNQVSGTVTSDGNRTSTTPGS